MTASDPRPEVWIGHTTMHVPDVSATRSFFLSLGMRDVVLTDGGIAILELRGGTHLVLQKSEDRVPENTPAPFDLMVDDLEASREKYTAVGLQPGSIQKNPIHHYFTIEEPGGHVVTINSSHVTDQPV